MMPHRVITSRIDLWWRSVGRVWLWCRTVSTTFSQVFLRFLPELVRCQRRLVFNRLFAVTGISPAALISSNAGPRLRQGNIILSDVLRQHTRWSDWLLKILLATNHPVVVNFVGFAYFLQSNLSSHSPSRFPTPWVPINFLEWWTFKFSWQFPWNCFAIKCKNLNQLCPSGETFNYPQLWSRSYPSWMSASLVRPRHSTVVDPKNWTGPLALESPRWGGIWHGMYQQG